VRPAAAFDDRDRLADAAHRFEIAQENDGIGEVGRIDGGLRVRADKAVLGHRQESGHVLLPEIGEQLVQLNQEETLFGHRLQVAVQTIDQDHAGADRPRSRFDGCLHGRGELAGRELRGVDLLNRDKT